VAPSLSDNIVYYAYLTAEDLLLNPKEHPTIKKGDIVEIYHPEDDDEKQKCRLLLQVSLAKDSQSRDYISVESSIALTFNLRNYGDVIMRVITDVSTVVLDSIEITFKDAYMGRSEMWRLKQYLTNTCVYINKKIEHCESIRCQGQLTLFLVLFSLCGAAATNNIV